MKILIKLALLITLAEALEAQPNVTTTTGPIFGANRITETGQRYYSFQGIPYAQPPDGQYRFRDPRPVVPWTVPRDCSREGPQFWGFSEETGMPEGDFDSLHVNVFTNNLVPAEAYPVMIWIHGGAFRAGSASTFFYNPEYLVERNVVFVSIQYRLGAFGFLSLDDQSLNVPGNAGMKDQRMALQWIRANIARFGGDVNRTMLFGHSSGGSSVHFHMLSPGSAGLFQRGYATGSNVLQNVVYSPRWNWAERLASRLGFNSTNEQALLNFLQTADPVRIVMEQGGVMDQTKSITKGFANAFGPVREPYVTDGVFFHEDLHTLLRQAWGNDIPFILGATSMENLPLVLNVRDGEEFLDLLSNFENFIPREAGIERNTDTSRYYARKIQNNYYPVLAPTATNVDGLVLLSSDMDLWYGIHRSVRHRLNAGRDAPTYVMRFDADTELSVFNRLASMLFPDLAIYREPMHGDEFAYFFKTAFNPPRNQLSYEALQLLDLMLTSLTNFAATGNPSIGSMNITWTPVTDRYQLLFGLNVRENNTQMMLLPEAERMKVFDEIMGGAGTMSLKLVKLLTFLWIIKSVI